jgi:hypothetical protein
MAIKRALPILVALACLGPAVAASSADTVTFGSDLSATPSLDTANGATHATEQASGSAIGPENAITPNPHAAADTAIFDTQLPGGGSAAAATGGQVLEVRIKGCAQEDTSAPTQTSQGSPVNEFHVQTLTPQGNGSYQIDQSSQDLIFPFCGGGVTTSTVSTFQPLHLCIKAGELVGFNDFGGFVPNPSGPSWYPQGVPYQIIAASHGGSMSSFVGPGMTFNGDAFGPGVGAGAFTGYAVESNEELLMQVQEGVVGDAYGLCPGGKGAETATSNSVYCDYGPGLNGHPSCNNGGLGPGGVPQNGSATAASKPSLTIFNQTDGVTHARHTTLSVFCAHSTCSGSLTVTARVRGRALALGHSTFSLPGGKSAKIPLQISPAALKALRRAPGRTLACTLTGSLGTGASFSHAVRLKI